MNKFRLKLRVIFWILLGGVIFWLFWMGVVPFGKATYVYNFSRENDFIGKLTPKERIIEPANGSQKIIGGPVYFTLRTPRRFEEALLTLKYRSEENVPIIEAGVLVDDIVWQYDLFPISNQIIDGLVSSWDVLMNGDAILLQRSDAEKKYEHIKDFFLSPPSFEKIALYNYNLDAEFFLEDYEPDYSLRIIEDKLQGAYQFFTYVKNEDLYFTFTFIDLNKNKGEDPINLLIYYKDKQIDSQYLEDDGLRDDSGRESGERFLNLELKNLPEGVYKIGIRTNDDIVTKKIETKQSKLSFINRINLFRQETSTNFSAKKIYTDSKKIQVKTIYPDRLQTLLIKGLNSPRSSYADEIKISETYKQFDSKKIESTQAEIMTERDGIILTGDGVFSFDPESIINPKFRKVDANLDVDKDGIDYVLSNYQASKNTNFYQEASVSFDLTGAALMNGEYKFVISIPSLKADDKSDDYLYLEEIRFDLKGTTLRDKLGKFFNF